MNRLRIVASWSLLLALAAAKAEAKVQKGRVRVEPNSKSDVRVVLVFSSDATEEEKLPLPTANRRPYRFDLELPPHLEEKSLTVTVEVDSPTDYAAVTPRFRKSPHEPLPAGFLRPIVLRPRDRVCRLKIDSVATSAPIAALRELEPLVGWNLPPDLHLQLRLTIAALQGKLSQWDRQLDTLERAFAEGRLRSVDAPWIRRYFKERLTGFDRMVPGSRRRFGEEVADDPRLETHWRSLVDDFFEQYPGCREAAAIPESGDDPTEDEIVAQRAALHRLIHPAGLSVDDCAATTPGT